MPDFLIVIYHGGLNQLNKSGKEREEKVNEAEKIMQTLGVIAITPSVCMIFSASFTFSSRSLPDLFN